MAVISVSLVAIVVSGYFLFSGGGAGDGGGGDEGEVRYGRAVVSPAGIVVRLPKGWKGERSGDLVRATSSDGTTKVAVAPKGTAATAVQSFRESINGIKAGLVNPAVGYPQQQRPFGGLPAATAVIQGRQKGGGPVGVVLMMVRGTKRAWIVSVLATGASSEEPLAEARAVLEVVELKG